MSSIERVLIYIYLLLRPYYFFNSGTLQISDYFLILAFLALIIRSKRQKANTKRIIKENIYLLVFIFFTLIINTIGFLTSPDTRFLLSTAYYLFGFCAVMLFSSNIKNAKFRNTIFKILVLNLFLQLSIYILSLGRYWHNSNRYMGTFNDPNQFGYYILLSFAYIYIINLSLKQKKLKIIVPYLISAFLILISQSTAMMIGFIAVTILLIIQNIKIIATNLKKIAKYIAVIIILIIPIIVICKAVIANNEALQTNIDNAMQRIEQKTDKINVNSSNKRNIFEDRALDYIYYYPEKLLYGAGEGAETEYDLVDHQTEIHSTYPALLFYYGIIPFIILMKWMYKKLKHLNGYLVAIYASLLLESFFLANQRQALFWVFIAIAPYINAIIKDNANKGQRMTS